jgi:gamma-glutamyl hercynylcysteine S-oxide synthase
MPTGVHTNSLASAIDAAMDEARRRTLRALSPLSADDLKAQPAPILSPLVWDLAHIGHQEELWLLRTLHGEQPTERRFDDIYNACEHERSERAELGLLEPADAYAYIDHVRERVRRRLPAERFPADEPLRRGGYAYHMVIQHEHQHNETMLQSFQVRDDLVHPFAELWRPARAEGRKTTISIDAGEFTMGTDEVGWAYDNEQRAHVRHVDAYAIDSHPVTNADYVRFVEAGGYADPGLWSDAGCRWLADEGETHPMFWRRSRGAWSRLRFGRIEPLPLEEPVQHISFHEAEAYARWAGARLPTEAEWERAVPHISYVGQVWEWTSSSFEPYPGFKAFPYEGYSAAFFGTGLYRVLRGGSWATHGKVGRHTFRNWDFPVRRQIFAGLRLAHDVGTTRRHRA